jgi:hypothetical protein
LSAIGVASALFVAAVAVASSTWPEFLPPPGELPTEVVELVKRVRANPTITRTIHGRPAGVPFAVYVGFVDAPDVTTAAARFLGIAKHEVRALGGDLYEATDHVNARGRYRVLVRGRYRRVILSWGEHRGGWLGAVRGAALSVVDFVPRDGRVEQSLVVDVLIENAVADRVLRILTTLFGTIVDRKLGEAFTIAGRVAEWAVERPGEFCGWLAREPLSDERRDAVVALLPACPGATPSPPRGGLSPFPAWTGRARDRNVRTARADDRREDGGGVPDVARAEAPGDPARPRPARARCARPLRRSARRAAAPEPCPALPARAGPA